MHCRRIGKQLTCGAAAVTIAWPAMAVKTYYIEEITDYTGNTCPNSGDLNTVTAELRDAMNSSGWSGSRWTNNDCWAQDWRESCSPFYGLGGTDSLWADTRLFTVFAGHGGNSGTLYFSFKNNNTCTNSLGPNSRLGTMGGAQAAYAAFLSSCTLTTNSIAAHANTQWVRQNLGFHDSPQIPFDAARQWLACTGNILFSQPNASCWLIAMEENTSGDAVNSPIAISYGTTATEAASIRDTAKLSRHTPSAYMAPRTSGPACGLDPPAFYYNWIRINNGSGPCQ